MNNDYILIQLKDSCYYDDDFKYDPFIIKKDDTFDKKYEELVALCQTYDDFTEVEDYIEENFDVIKFDKRVINV